MRSKFACVLGIVVLAGWAVGVAAEDRAAADRVDAGQHEAGAHVHAEAAKLKNPVNVTAESVAAGKKVFDAQCASCHGAAGRGDGKMATSITGPKPADLTDASWKHGSTDGEIFTLIRDGAKGTGMRAFASRMKTDDIWNVVNYVKTLGPNPPKTH